MKRQEGATLFIALIFLAVLMLLGVTAVRNSLFQERMAANTHQQNMAFGAAEAAIGALMELSKATNNNILLRTRINGVVDTCINQTGNEVACGIGYLDGDKNSLTTASLRVERAGCQPKSCEGFSVGSKNCQFYDVTATSTVAGAMSEQILWSGYELSAQCF